MARALTGDFVEIGNSEIRERVRKFQIRTKDDPSSFWPGATIHSPSAEICNRLELGVPLSTFPLSWSTKSSWPEERFHKPTLPSLMMVTILLSLSANLAVRIHSLCVTGVLRKSPRQHCHK